MPAPIFGQDGVYTYRVFADDGGNTATPLAALETPATILPGSRARVRIGYQCWQITNFKAFLQYQVNGGSWITATTSTDIQISPSSQFVDGAATTNRITQLSGSLNFQGGELIEAARLTNGLMIPQNGSCYEFEWSLLFSNVAPGDIIGFRLALTGSGGTFGSGTGSALFAIPTVNIVFTLGGATMPAGDNAYVLRQSQLGFENTNGTAVAANRIIRSVSIQPKPVNPTAQLRAKGSRINTHQVGLQGAYTTASLEGFAAFQDMPLLLASLCKAPTITTPVVNFTGNTTISSPSVTSVSSTVGLAVGQTVTGTGIPGSTTIIAISGNTLTLSANATANGSGVALSTTTTLGRDWTYLLTASAIETPKCMTIEDGLQTVDVSRFAYAMLNSLRLDFSNTREITVNGDIFGNLLAEEGVVPTGTAAIAFTANTTSGQPTLAAASTLVGLFLGQTVTGTGIPAATTIIGINVGTNVITLSANATANGSGVALSAVITAIPEVTCLPMSPDFIDWFVADTSTNAALAAGRLNAVYGGNFELSGRRKPVFPQRSDVPGMGGIVATENRCFMRVTMEKDSQADTMLRLSRTWRGRYLRLLVTGQAIESGWFNEFEITLAFKVANPDRGNTDEVYGAIYDLEAVNDPTLGGFASIRCRTALTALPTSSDLATAQQPNTLIAALGLVGNV